MANPWDVNRDGFVDDTDVGIVTEFLGKSPLDSKYNPDVNRDGKVDTKDLEIVNNHVNHPPTADSQSISTEEGFSVDITLTGNDQDNNPLIFKVTIKPANGKLSGAFPDLIYEPNNGFTGTDSLTFIVNDGTYDSPPATISITVKKIDNPWDVNRDGSVNILDLLIVSKYFGKSVFPTDYNPDVNKDGKVDINDFELVRKHFGNK
jgi:hypothetical protein